MKEINTDKITKHLVVVFMGTLFGGLLKILSYEIISVFSKDYASLFFDITNFGGGIKNFIPVAIIGTPIMYWILKDTEYWSDKDKENFHNKTGNNKKTDGEYIKDNYDTLIKYWSDIVAGDENLKNGKKFDSLAFYNPKLLKYELNQLEIALMLTGHHAWKKNDKELLSSTQTCYMFLANFLDDIPENFESEPQKFNELLMSYKNVKNENEKKDLINKFASMDTDKMSEANNMLTKRQLEFSNHFTTSIEKFVNKNQK
jgi:hypothetical protein